MSDIMPYNRVIGTLLANPDAKQAVLYLSPKRVVRATRRMYGRARGKRPRPSRKVIEIALHDGPPNYRERQVLRRAKRAGRPSCAFWEIEVR